MSLNYGAFSGILSYKTLCTTAEDCKMYESGPGDYYVCSKYILNPDNDSINFDNTLNSLLVVYITITMEGWTDVFIYLTRAFKSSIYINLAMINLWFISLILVGGYLLISMFLAVVKSSFTDLHAKIYAEKVSLKPFAELLLLKKDIEENEREKDEAKEADPVDNNNDEINETEVTKDIYSYSIVKDISILQNSTPEEVYLLNKKIEKNNQWVKQMEERKDHILKTESLGINRVDYKFQMFMANDLDYNEENINRCKLRTMNFFKILNEENRNEIYENYKSFNDVNGDMDLMGERREGRRKSMAIVRDMNRILKKRISMRDISVLSDESLNSSELSGHDSVKVTKFFKRKTMLLSNFILQQDEDYTKQFKHMPWEFMPNCDDIEFRNKFKLKKEQIEHYSKWGKSRQSKSIEKNQFKYQKIILKDIIRESKTKSKERIEKSKF